MYKSISFKSYVAAKSKKAKTNTLKVNRDSEKAFIEIADIVTNAQRYISTRKGDFLTGTQARKIFVPWAKEILKKSKAFPEKTDGRRLAEGSADAILEMFGELHPQDVSILFAFFRKQVWDVLIHNFNELAKLFDVEILNKSFDEANRKWQEYRDEVLDHNAKELEKVNEELSKKLAEEREKLQSERQRRVEKQRRDSPKPSDPFFNRSPSADQTSSRERSTVAELVDREEREPESVYKDDLEDSDYSSSLYEDFMSGNLEERFMSVPPLEFPDEEEFDLIVDEDIGEAIDFSEVYGNSPERAIAELKRFESDWERKLDKLEELDPESAAAQRELLGKIDREEEIKNVNDFDFFRESFSDFKDFVTHVPKLIEDSKGNTVSDKEITEEEAIRLLAKTIYERSEIFGPKVYEFMGAIQTAITKFSAFNKEFFKWTQHSVQERGVLVRTISNPMEKALYESRGDIEIKHRTIAKDGLDTIQGMIKSLKGAHKELLDTGYIHAVDSGAQREIKEAIDRISDVQNAGSAEWRRPSAEFAEYLANPDYDDPRSSFRAMLNKLAEDLTDVQIILQNVPRVLEKQKDSMGVLLDAFDSNSSPEEDKIMLGVAQKVSDNLPLRDEDKLRTVLALMFRDITESRGDYDGDITGFTGIYFRS